MNEPLTPAARIQLELDLDRLPVLVDLLHRHYDDLLALGSRNPDDPAERYPIRPEVLDLTNRRWKDGTIYDPAGEADLTARIGARRHGILPTLTSWVSRAAGAMHDQNITHTPPINPDQIVYAIDSHGLATLTRPCATPTTEAGWLRHHLDWILSWEYAPELALDMRLICADLEQLPLWAAANDHACLTYSQAAETLGISTATLYRWADEGRIHPVTDQNGQKLFVIREVRQVIARRKQTKARTSTTWTPRPRVTRRKG